jgi:hypothetical protein
VQIHKWMTFALFHGQKVKDNIYLMQAIS